MRYIFRLIRSAIAIDVFRLHPNACHKPLRNNFELSLQKNPYRNRRWFPRSWLIARFLGRAFYHTLRTRHTSPQLAGRVAFLSQTKNQARALEPVQQQLDYHIKTAVISNEELKFVNRWGAAFWLSLPFAPCLLWNWFRADNYSRASFAHVVDCHLHTYGLYIVLRLWMRRERLAGLVVSNDHVQLPCVMVAAAKAEAIPTFYIQHACVTNCFPPLAMDYALLDGQDAKEKYLNAGQTSAEIALVGPTRMDGYQANINRESTVQSIGICFSPADRTDKILELMDAIGTLRGYTITIRPHYSTPQGLTQTLVKLATENNYRFSVHTDESAVEFLKTVDLLICGVSSIALEAALMNVSVVNFQLNEDDIDWYGFIENNLLDTFSETTKLVAHIDQQRQLRTGNRDRAKRYVASIDTPHDGASSQAAVELILNHVQRPA